MGFFDFIFGDNDGKPEDRKPGGLASVLGFMSKLGKEMEKDPENPIMAFFKAIFSLVKEELFPGKKDAPDFHDGTPEEQARARREYETTRRAQEQQLPQYSASVRERVTPEFVTQEPQRLLDLKKRIEAGNGGKRIQPIIPVADNVRITEDIGHRHAPTKGATVQHQGLDIAGSKPGDKPDIISPMPGRVEFTGWKEGYGNTVDIVDMYGVTHRLAHLQSITVKPGMEVAQGDKVGVMGQTGRATGVHLHYEQRKDGVPIDPVMMARTWKEGEKASHGQNLAFMQSQQAGTAYAAAPAPRPSVDAQLAQMNLGGTVSSSNEGSFIPPSLAGAVKGKATGKSGGHS